MLDGPGDIRRGEVGAVMELDAIADGDVPGQAILGKAPIGGDPRDQFRFGGGFDKKAVKDSSVAVAGAAAEGPVEPFIAPSGHHEGDVAGVDLDHAGFPGLDRGLGYGGRSRFSGRLGRGLLRSHLSGRQGFLGGGGGRAAGHTEDEGECQHRQDDLPSPKS